MLRFERKKLFNVFFIRVGAMNGRKIIITLLILCDTNLIFLSKKFIGPRNSIIHFIVVIFCSFRWRSTAAGAGIICSYTTSTCCMIRIVDCRSAQYWSAFKRGWFRKIFILHLFLGPFVLCPILFLCLPSSIRTSSTSSTNRVREGCSGNMDTRTACIKSR